MAPILIFAIAMIHPILAQSIHSILREGHAGRAPHSLHSKIEIVGSLTHTEERLKHKQ